MVFGFFYVAGYTFKDKPFLVFLKEKVLRIYIPFVMASLFVLLLINIFPGYFQLNEPLNQGIITNIFLFNYAKYLMAPSWFLLPLFIILFLFYFLKKILRKDYILLLLTTIIFIVVNMYSKELSIYTWNNCAVITNIGFGLFLFSCGYFLKNHQTIEQTIFEGKYSTDVFIVSLILLSDIITKQKYSIDLRIGFFSNSFYTILITLLGMYFLIFLSKFIEKQSTISKKIISVVGRHSMSIMLFHVISFSLLTICIHYISSIPIPNNWTKSYSHGVFDIITALFGIFFPIVVSYLIKFIREKINISFAKIKLKNN